MEKIIQISDDLIYKYGSYEELNGYVEYVSKCPDDIRDLFPKVLEFDEQKPRLLMKFIHGINLGIMYSYNAISLEIFDKVLDTLERIHQVPSDQIDCSEDTLVVNFHPKLKDRIEKHKSLYNTLNLSTSLSTIANALYSFYESNRYQPRFSSCIHGDAWLSNMIWNHKEQRLYMIDMRGRIGNIYTTNGDQCYDYAKLYQSIMGFDHIMYSGKVPDQQLQADLLNSFNRFLSKKHLSIEYISTLCLTLLLGSYSFHTQLHTEPGKNIYESIINKLWQTISL